MSASGIWNLWDIQRANGEALYGAKFDGVFEYLIVAGGGGAPEWAAGAGAGGFLMGSFTRSTNPRGVTLTSEPVVIGAGGAGGTGYFRVGSTGSDSSFLGLIAKGGGGGASASSSALAGGNGGSGGGGSNNGAGGTAVTGQGFSGAQGSSGPTYGQSGGGGAGGPGVKSTHTGSAPHRPGHGGPGKQWINGKYYAGGGGGGTDSRNAGWQDGLGVGGVGGGGSGGQPGGPGQANTGGGGGGGTIGYAGGNGGSGVVIVRYKGRTAKLSGGIVSYDNGYTYHQFNSSGTLIFL